MLQLEVEADEREREMDGKVIQRKKEKPPLNKSQAFMLEPAGNSQIQTPLAFAAFCFS